MKSLSAESLKRSFEIWLSRESFQWSRNQFPVQGEPQKTSLPSNTLPKKTKPASNKITNNTKVSSVEFQKNVSLMQSYKNCRIFNKGNTCYLNACLQCLSTMVSFWSNLTMCTSQVSPFTLSFVKIMSLLRSSKGPIDPSHFIKLFQRLVTDSGKVDFNVFQQQDAAEALTYILEELSSISPSANNIVEKSFRVTITCQKCNQDNLKEDSTKVLQVPVEANLQSSLNKFLAPEVLCGENAYFCNFCQSHEAAFVSYNLSSVGQFLILQTKRFSQSRSGFVKHLHKIACNQYLSVPIVSENNIVEKFKLLGTINHSGSLDRGHYTAFIKKVNDNSWLHCNDAAVLSVKEESLNNNSSYIYFYELL